jgi:mannose-6-phosphate isomerase-like protein (cupin superfamily)
MNRRVTFVAGLAAGVMLTVGLSRVPLPALSGDVLAQGAQAGAAAGTQAGATAGRKNTSKIVLENARVRVKEAVFYPEDAHPGMHTHDLPHVGVPIEGGTMIFKSPDGKTESMTLTPGTAGFREANVTHEPINTGTKPVRVIEVELK